MPNNISVSSEIAKALSHPQSKKCFIKASQIIASIIKVSQPEKRTPNIEPTITPIAIIAIASVNLAFSLPTNPLPESHNAGDNTIIAIIMLINKGIIGKKSKLKAKIFVLRKKVIVKYLLNLSHFIAFIEF
jgi:hypothetical protein